MKTYWISCDKFTVGVVCKDDFTITSCPPIMKKFKGQSFVRLLDWTYQNFEDVEYKEICKS